MPRTTRPTSRDVAAAAGVSVATVSYVMNGRTDSRIPDTTRDRVLAAAREIGYAPNRAARNLRRRRTEQVCLVIGSFGVPVYDRLARSLLEVGEQFGYGLITIGVSSPKTAELAVQRLRERIADGVLIASEIQHLQPEAIHRIAESGLPMLVMSNTIEPDGFDIYRAPEAPAVDEAMAHLLAGGRRTIAYLGHRHEVANFHRPGARRSEELSAYVEALQSRGFSVDPSLVVPGADDRVSGYEAVVALLSGPKRPDAIFVASARAAVSAIWAARDLDVAVPGDLAIVGAGSLPEVRVTRPTLSTVGPPVGEDFADAAQLLFDRVTGGKPAPGREIGQPWRFFPRGST